MSASHLVVVSPPGSGTHLMHQATTALGYTSMGTLSTAPGPEPRPGPGEVYPLLEAAYGRPHALTLLREGRQDTRVLQDALAPACGVLWRVWWQRLGQPVAAAGSPDACIEQRLARLPQPELHRLLPGRTCWYVRSLPLHRVDADLLRTWHTTGRPRIVLHERDIRDRIVHTVHRLSQTDPGTTLPDHLVHHRILAALPTAEARLTLALTAPDFPGIRDTRHNTWLTHHPDVCVIRHEDLAGPAHGGTHHARDEALERLAHATGHHPRTSPAPAMPRAAGHDQGQNPLRIGMWRSHFTPRHERLLRQHLPGLLPATPPQRRADAPAGAHAAAHLPL